MAMAEEEVRARRISFRLDRREPPLLTLRERSRPLLLCRLPPYTCPPPPTHPSHEHPSAHPTHHTPNASAHPTPCIPRTGAHTRQKVARACVPEAQLCKYRFE